MSGSERNSHASCKCDPVFRKERIRRMNDELRKYGRGGIIVITAGLSALGTDRVREILHAVRRFDSFTDDNDPYREHDLGAFRMTGDKIMWKIDYYDKERRYGSPDPANPDVATRILTIMLAGEY